VGGFSFERWLSRFKSAAENIANVGVIFFGGLP
jgi:hypothetical protein